MPPALQSQPVVITLKQYEALPEIRRVEVFESVVYDMQLSTIINSHILRKKGSCR